METLILGILIYLLGGYFAHLMMRVLRIYDRPSLAYLSWIAVLILIKKL